METHSSASRSSTTYSKASWPSTKKSVSFRKRREPSKTPLYRLVYNLHEELERVWEAQFQPDYGVYRSSVKEAFNDYLNCGILLHGCAVAECESCKHTELIAFSCKQRGICSSCDAKRAVIFAEKLYNDTLLDLSYSHIVFTIPKRLRVYFKYNRKLTKHLYVAAWNTWNELIEDAFPDSKSGMVMSLHTAGDLLNFHPHVHALALYGAIDKDNTFNLLDSINTDWLNTVFARNIFDALLSEELVDEQTVTSMKSWQHSGFNVWVGSPVHKSDTNSIKFLARYLKKPAVSNQRLEFIEKSNTVRYFKDNHKSEFIDFEPLHFLAQLSQHIPNKWEQTTRFFGICSARTKGARKNQNLSEITSVSNLESKLDSSIDKTRPSASWAACMKLVFEIDPLECPKCGKSMKIKSFITDSKEIARLTTHIGTQAWRAPPPFKNLTSAISICDDLYQ